MRRRSRLTPPLRVALLLGAMLAALGAPRRAAAAAAVPAVSYYDDIKPLLAVHCYKCHGPDAAAKGGLRLDLRERAFAAGESGTPGVVPGDSGHSEVYRRIASHDPDEVMPRKGERLTPAEVERVRRWIDGGARWPDRDDYWAFQPPVPAAGGDGTSRNPIDAFIEARLADEKIAPGPPADARTLLRRAYADLLGVPPSPEEADAFLNDTSPHAYERLVDRLLADERYGERWARHWLDLVRYSESDGFEDDKVRPLAWRYRDYVIRSLNADKPYDRFVKEQVAGDELWPDSPEAWVATGFARLGAWDGMSKVPEQRRQDFLNDATDAVGSVFLGVTLGCARCHDHKYDAIKQTDYYGVQAFFAGAKRDTRDLPGDPHDPPQVEAARNGAMAGALVTLRGERDAILREAREALEQGHAAKSDGKSRAKVTPEQVKKEAERSHPGRLAELDKQTAKWEPTRRATALAAEAVFDAGGDAPKTFLLMGGELGRPGPEVAPHFVEAMARGAAPSATKGAGRRAALAKWLASADNPLTARVWVNRLWQHHFGRGLVATPSDFGRHGQAPNHRELLDWLACRLVADGWSTKAMHRLMMTSDAYRRSSATDPAAAAVDPDNKLLWRMDRRRLEAEAIRDSILTVSGRLSPVRGGPGVYPRISKDVNVQLPNNDKELSWGTCTEEEDRRRTVYVFQRRSLTFPLVDVFDGAAMSQTCPVRAVTTVAPQALALLNGEFGREEARHLADRARREAGDDAGRRVERVFRLALARGPTEGERAAAEAFLTKQAEVRRPDGDAEAAAFADFCHVILNTNEFVYID